MAKKMTAVFILITSMTIIGVQAKAQTPKRIQFAKGQSSTSVKGTTGNYGVSYVVRAKSGQKLVLKLTPISGLGIKVETEGTEGQRVLLREEKGGTYEIGLDESGDYTIFIGSTTGRPISFTLTIKIAKLADI